MDGRKVFDVYPITFLLGEIAAFTVADHWFIGYLWNGLGKQRASERARHRWIGMGALFLSFRFVLLERCQRVHEGIHERVAAKIVWYWTWAFFDSLW